MVLNFRRHIEYQKETTVSKVLMKATGGTVTLFAFAAEQALSEHTAPLNALLPPRRHRRHRLQDAAHHEQGVTGTPGLVQRLV